MDISADKDFSQELKKLKATIKKIPADRRAVAETLFVEVEFMAATLGQLRSSVTVHGVVEMFKQGKQQFMRESPALKAYNTTIQRYSLLYKQITDMLPKPVPKPKKDDGALIKFIKK
jgi:hypothetical protein